ncbi:hypothetical protein GCM10009117_13830 [Gangjinia marincola]|uniref:Glycosyltransferase n=1 Tax=Gangjinia marincola TaxID=578463 RepID=A0ABP3XS60_9FLAO
MKKFKNLIAGILRFIFSSYPKDEKDIPIFINNYNRLSTLKLLIIALKKREYTNIHILDNQSTYPPLLEFYKTTECHVHLLKKNYGSKAFWKSGLWLRFVNSYFVLTDSDVVPVDECPSDFLKFFLQMLKKYPIVHKIGFSLKIDDLPDHYANKQKVIEWEKKYYQQSIEQHIFIAPIDTTFALYRPFSKVGERDERTLVLRTGFPYQARHLPWYINSNALDDEEKFYLNSLNTRTHWSRRNLSF